MPSSDMDLERPKSREDSVLTTNTDDFIIGDRVWVNGTKPGYIQYLGETQFSPGDWAGVVLDDNAGKNDGSVAGVRYFQCEPKRGVFARLHKLTRYPLLHATSPNSKHCDAPTPPPIQRCLTPTRTPSPGARNLREGDRVQVSGSSGQVKTGVLRYLGQTDFAAGEWVGIELDEPLGKNDGTVAGKRYFKCSPNYGLFSPVHKVSKIAGSLDRHRRINNTEDQKRFVEENDKKAQRLRQLLEAAENERKDLAAKLKEERRKVEELEFRIEEECIGKDDLESEREKERRRIEDLERRLDQEIRKNEMIARGATPDSILKEETKQLNEEIEKTREKLRQAEEKIKELQTTKQIPSSSSLNRADELTKKEEQLLQMQLSLDNKKREVQNLLDRIAELEKELERSKTRQSRQLDSIDELNMKLQKSESKRESLEEEMHTIKDKMEELERRLKTTWERVSSLESDKRKLEEQLLKPESTSEDQALLARIEDREKELAEWRKEADAFRTEADKLREDRDRIKKELEEKIRQLNEDHSEECRKEKKKLTESENTSATRIRELERALTTVRADLEAAKTESYARLSRQEARLQEAELKANNMDRLKDQVSRLQAEKDLIGLEKEEMWKRLQTSEEAKQKWEAEAGRATDEVNLLKGQVQNLRTEFSKHREDLTKKLAQTKFDAQMVQDLHNEIEEQRRLVEIMQQRLRSTEGERDQLHCALTSKEEEKKQVESSLGQEMEALKRRLAESEAERKSVKRSIEATQLLVEERSATQQQQQNKLLELTEKERERLERKISDLQSELNSLKTGKSDPDAEVEKLKIDRDTLEQQVHFMNTVIVDMQHKNDDLRSRLDILETEVLFDGQLQIGTSNRSTSRLFCDICGVFDIHDTEDCPKQLSFIRRTLSYSSQESEF